LWQHNIDRDCEIRKIRINQLLHGDDSFYWQDPGSDDPSSVSLNKLDTSDRSRTYADPPKWSSKTTEIIKGDKNVQELVKKFDESHNIPIHTKSSRVSTTTSATATSSYSLNKTGKAISLQVPRIRYDLPDSCSSEHEYMSRASILSTPVEEAELDDFLGPKYDSSIHQRLPEMIEPTRLRQQEQEQLKRRRPTIQEEEAVKRSQNGVWSRFRQHQKKQPRGTHHSKKTTGREKTYQDPTRRSPAILNRLKDTRKPKSILRLPKLSQATHGDRTDIPGGSRHYSSPPVNSRRHHHYRKDDDSSLVSRQALFEELQRRNNVASPTKRWGYYQKSEGSGSLVGRSIHAREKEEEFPDQHHYGSMVAKYGRTSGSTISTRNSRGSRESILRLEHSFSTLNDEEEHEIVFVSDHADDRQDKEQRDDHDVGQDIFSEYEAMAFTSGTRETVAVIEEEEEEIMFSPDHDEVVVKDQMASNTQTREKTQHDKKSRAVFETKASGASNSCRNMGPCTSSDDEESKMGIETVLSEIPPTRSQGSKNSSDIRSCRSTEHSVVVHVSLSAEEAANGSREIARRGGGEQAKSKTSKCDATEVPKATSKYDVTEAPKATSKYDVTKVPNARSPALMNLSEDDSKTLRAENPRIDTARSMQSSNILRPSEDIRIGGDWSYSEELKNNSSDTSSLDRTRVVRSIATSNGAAMGSLDAFFFRATDLLVSGTRDLFFTAKEPTKANPSTPSQAEIRAMCQKLSNLVYPQESSVVAQAVIPRAISKIGISLEQHEWRFVIRRIEKGSPFANSPLRVGQTLLSLNGIPVNFFQSVPDVIEYLRSREWSNGVENDSVLSIVATKSIFATVIKPTADTLVGLGFAMNHDQGTLKIHHIDPKGLFGLNGRMMVGARVIRLNGRPCPRTSAALNAMIKACVGPFTIVGIIDAK
jgi:hypothetical protein